LVYYIFYDSLNFPFTKFVHFNFDLNVLGHWIIELVKALETLPDKTTLLRVARANTARCKTLV